LEGPARYISQLICLLHKSHHLTDIIATMLRPNYFLPQRVHCGGRAAPGRGSACGFRTSGRGGAAPPASSSSPATGAGWPRDRGGGGAPMCVPRWSPDGCPMPPPRLQRFVSFHPFGHRHHSNGPSSLASYGFCDVAIQCRFGLLRDGGCSILMLLICGRPIQGRRQRGQYGVGCGTPRCNHGPGTPAATLQRFCTQGFALVTHCCEPPPLRKHRGGCLSRGGSAPPFYAFLRLFSAYFKILMESAFPRLFPLKAA